MRILIVSNTTKNNYDSVKDKLERYYVEFSDRNDYIEKVPEHEYIIAGRERYTKELLEKSNRLKVISRCGHGTDAIDKKTARDKGIKVLDAREALDDTMADVTIGYMIAALRKIVEIDRGVREEGWKTILGNDLTGKTVGIIGLGGIGTAVAKRLTCFKTNTIFYDIDEEKQHGYPYAKFLERDAVFRSSDVLTLHCDLNENSKNMINEKTIPMMKDGVVLVNTARGPMIDLEALSKSLANGKIGYAVLDVYPEEPLPNDHKIRSISNVLLGAHTTCYSEEGQRKLAIKAVDNLLKEIK